MCFRMCLLRRNNRSVCDSCCKIHSWNDGNYSFFNLKSTTCCASRSSVLTRWQRASRIRCAPAAGSDRMASRRCLGREVGLSPGTRPALTRTPHRTSRPAASRRAQRQQQLKSKSRRNTRTSSLASTSSRSPSRRPVSGANRHSTSSRKSVAALLRSHMNRGRLLSFASGSQSLCSAAMPTVCWARWRRRTLAHSPSNEWFKLLSTLRVLTYITLF